MILLVSIILIEYNDIFASKRNNNLIFLFRKNTIGSQKPNFVVSQFYLKKETPMFSVYINI